MFGRRNNRNDDAVKNLRQSSISFNRKRLNETQRKLRDLEYWHRNGRDKDPRAYRALKQQFEQEMRVQKANLRDLGDM